MWHNERRQFDSGDGGNAGGGAVIDESLDTGLDEGIDDGQDGGNGGNASDDGQDPFAGYDDDKVIQYLQKKKGLPYDNLDKLANLDKNLSGLTKKHQDTKRMLSALQSALGEDYESVLARAMSSQVDGDEVQLNGGGRNQFAGDEPAVFKRLDPAVRKDFQEMHSYLFQKELPQLAKSVVNAITRLQDEESFKQSDPDYETNQESYQNIAEKYGITKRDKETLMLIKKLHEESLSGAMSGLAGNETGTRRKTGSPPPKGGDRGERKTEPNWDDPEARKHYYEKLKSDSQT